MKYTKKFLALLLALILSIGVFAGCAPQTAPDTSTEKISQITDTTTAENHKEPDFSDQHVLVILNPSANFTDYTIEDFTEVNCISVKELTVGEVEEDKPCRILLLTIGEPSKENVLNTIQKLNQRDDIYIAEPDYIEYPEDVDVPEATPNDDYVSSTYQWAINKLWLASAWNITTGSSTIRVGVIDTGIDGSHPDLTNRIDRTLSKNFSPDYDNALEDASGHGTHVAGIIGAQGNNNIGISGTCWNIKLVSLRVATESGGFKISSVIDAINYANNNNIPILNYSGGGYDYNTTITSRDLAIKQYYGLFVCAAGNETNNNDSTPHYPSNNKYANLISVGASTETDAIAGFSNYGAAKVDLFAPGERIISCTPTSLCQNGSCNASTHVADGYHYKSGTSMATPYVTGVAALLLSKYPSMTAYQLKKEILENITEVAALQNLCLTDGRLNAYKALNNVTCVHNYTGYTSISIASHKTTCSCGDYVSLPHEFTQSGSTLICSLCGYSSISLNNTGLQNEAQ